MTSIVLDASFTLPLYLHDERSREIESVLALWGNGDALLCTTPHWRLECWNALLRATRRKRILRDDMQRSMHELSRLPVLRYPDQAPIERIAAIAEKYGLSMNDAAYLALALEEGALLATNDEHLGAAAESCGARWRPSRRARKR